jgi:hypothetical protein
MKHLKALIALVPIAALTAMYIFMYSSLVTFNIIAAIVTIACIWKMPKEYNGARLILLYPTIGMVAIYQMNPIFVTPLLLLLALVMFKPMFKGAASFYICIIFTSTLILGYYQFGVRETELADIFMASFRNLPAHTFYIFVYILGYVALLDEAPYKDNKKLTEEENEDAKDKFKKEARRRSYIRSKNFISGCVAGTVLGPLLGMLMSSFVL